MRVSGSEPAKEMGGQCAKPFTCEFQAYCSKGQPDPAEWPVDILPRTGRKIADEMAVLGIFDLRDVPADALRNRQHQIIRQVTISGVPHHDVESVKSATAEWSFPRHYLDFETIALPVPAWIGTRPYQQVPFQFSCHSEQSDGQFTHHSFISLDGADPRRKCAEALIDCLGDRGAIIAYNASFERSCVNGLTCPPKSPSI